MRVLTVIAVLVGLAFIILFVLTDLARELSRQPFQAPPDLDSTEDWDVVADELAEAAPPVVYCAEQQAAGRYPVERMRGNHVPGSSNAIDDLRWTVDVV